MNQSGKLGFWGLAALVFGMVVGAGTYNLPQSMATTAGPLAVSLAWVVTGAGLLPLTLGFKWLSERFPKLNAGIYEYAQEGFGNFAGFNMAWGYWLCSAFSNVTYGVILNDSVGAFFPPLLEHGWQTALFISALVWVMYAVVARGVQTAKTVNTILAAVKVVMLIFIIVLMFIAFKAGIFELNWARALPGVGGVGEQMKSTMMITLFCFFGIEGAVMMSARAKRPDDVGRATMVGFLLSLAVYMAVSLLCFGLMRSAELSGLSDPSIATVLRATCGEWAYWFVICALIVSLLGGWVAWTLVVAQVPYEAAVVRILPKVFLRTNRRGVPTFGLAASSVVMTLFIVVLIFAENVYIAAINVSGLMIIPGYLFTGLFLLKEGTRLKENRMVFFGAVTTLFCLWMAYAGGLMGMLMTSILYVAGLGFYVKARHENAPGQPLFRPAEKRMLWLLCVAALISAGLLLCGYSPI